MLTESYTSYSLDGLTSSPSSGSNGNGYVLINDQKLTIAELESAYLSSFESVSLEETANVTLMDRVDTKFIFPANKLPDILKQLYKKYKILEIENKRYSNFETVYLDTDGFEFFKQHHNGKLNRYKLRFRNYLNTRMHFLESKFKTNKARTRKNRLLREDAPDFFKLKKEEKSFISKFVPQKGDDLSPKLWVYFTRLSFVHKEIPERLTIDLHLSYQYKSASCGFPEVIVAEVKQSRRTGRCDFLKIMKELQIKRTPFSKYCIGIAIMHPEVKRNRFKKILLKLNQIRSRNGITNNTRR